MKDKISIIVPVYNGEKYLEECVESILAQTYKNIEVILVNDGSSDSSLDICKMFEKKDSRVKVVDSENFGVSHARNLGIEKSTGEFIAFVDCDDFISKEYCEVLYNGMSDGIDLSVANAIKTDKRTIENNTIYNKYEQLDKHIAYYRIPVVEGFYAYPVNKLYRKSIIKKIGDKPFDEDIHVAEDYLFNAKYLSYCNKINYNNSIVYYYYYNDDSATRYSYYSEKKATVITSMDRIVDIYREESPENLAYAYTFYLLMIYNLEICLYNSKIKKSIKNKETQKMLKAILKCKNIKFIKKIYTIFRYYTPVLFSKIRLLAREH